MLCYQKENYLNVVQAASTTSNLCLSTENDNLTFKKTPYAISRRGCYENIPQVIKHDSYQTDKDLSRDRTRKLK